MNIELQQKLIEFAEEIIENKRESRYKGLPPWKKGVGILPGDAPYLFSEVLQMLLRDDKINHLKKRDIEGSLWEFVLDIKTNPQRYSSRDDILYETENFYSGIAEEDKEYEILLPLKNVGIREEISTKDFELRILDQNLAEEWRLEWGLLEDEKDKVVLLTTVKANIFWKAIRRGKNKCFSFLALLQILPRIYKRSKISPDGSFIYIRAFPQNRIGWARLDEKSQKTYLPAENDMNYLQKWSDLLTSHPTEMTKRVTAGIKLLAEAHTEPEIIMKLIKVFMALETVFTGGDPRTKKYNLMLRATLFLSRRKRGFPFPSIFVWLYNSRNKFMHEATEIDLPEVDLISLEKEINNIIFFSKVIYLELVDLLHEKAFENHKSFVHWLCKKDDIYSATVVWIAGIPWVRSIAEEAGAREDQIESVAKEMVEMGEITLKGARKTLKKLKSETEDKIQSLHQNHDE